VEPGWTLRSLADRLGVKHSKVQRAIERLERAGLYDARRRAAIPHAAEEFLLHALKYLHPISEGAPTRGVPTAWAALPLSREIAAPAELPPVWPDPHGTVRGLSVESLDDALPRLASNGPRP
jgi:DNA-binding transcriptional MocR family regulator